MMPLKKAGDDGMPATSGPIRIHTDPAQRVMTTEEKSKLKMNIGKLTADQQRGIVPIVQKCVERSNSSVVQFELDKLSSECLVELENYVNK